MHQTNNMRNWSVFESPGIINLVLIWNVQLYYFQVVLFCGLLLAFNFQCHLKMWAFILRLSLCTHWLVVRWFFLFWWKDVLRWIVHLLDMLRRVLFYSITVILNELAITYFNRSCIISLKQANSNAFDFVVITKYYNISITDGYLFDDTHRKPCFECEPNVILLGYLCQRTECVPTQISETNIYHMDQWSVSKRIQPPKW